MKIKEWTGGAFILSLAILAQTACNRDSGQRSIASSKSPPANVIKFRALIDGADTVKIQGSNVWYVHESWELPGKWQGRDENTTINGQPWHPVWPASSKDPADTPWPMPQIPPWKTQAPINSKPYPGLQPAFAPTSPTDIKLAKIAGRGEVSIKQLPGPENLQTLSLHFDDTQFGGADWYEAAITWHDDSTTNVIKIKALIDGADTVKIKGSNVWYEHESWELPGKSHDQDAMTMIDDQPWHPEWLGQTDRAPSFPHVPRQAKDLKTSEPYGGLQPAFEPKSPAAIKVTKIAGRGEVKISELPTAENHQTLSIHFDDAPIKYLGADWYEVSIEWK